MQAIYVRQSVDKKDSISIETQIEECTKKLNSNEEFKVFSDKGFSGKSVDNRPAFQSMMREVEKDNVSRIIIYKYDRISRSLHDFVNMENEFRKHNIALISVQEGTDTSTLNGRAMVNILMSFAEMERETIQQRVIDNYYARGEKGYYLGGCAPFGYTKVLTTLHGKNTSTFEENKNESAILKSMYQGYIDGLSLSEIARRLNDKKVPTRREKRWTGGAVSRILRNPVYVKANADIYNYLVTLGATMNNKIEDYVGENGCYAYGNAKKREGTKFSNLTNQFVTLGLHKGIIEPSMWLEAQYVMNKKVNHSNQGTGKLTWLQGLMKCKCGYSLYVKRYKRPYGDLKYLYCRGRRFNSCGYSRKMLRVDHVENIVEEAILNRLGELKEIKNEKVVRDSPEINHLKIQLAEIDKKINNMLDQMANGEDVTVKYINEFIKKLDFEKQNISEEIVKKELQESRKNNISFDIDGIINNWKDIDFDIKKKIARQLIEEIIIEGRNIEIIFF